MDRAQVALISRTWRALETFVGGVRQIGMDDRIQTAAQELRQATEAVLKACIAHQDLDLRRAQAWAAIARAELRFELCAAAFVQPWIPLAESARR